MSRCNPYVPRVHHKTLQVPKEDVSAMISPKVINMEKERKVTMVEKEKQSKEVFQKNESTRETAEEKRIDKRDKKRKANIVGYDVSSISLPLSVPESTKALPTSLLNNVSDFPAIARDPGDSLKIPNPTKRWPPKLPESCKRQRRPPLNNVPDSLAAASGPLDRDSTNPREDFQRASLSRKLPPKFPESCKRQPKPPLNNVPDSNQEKEGVHLTADSPAAARESLNRDFPNHIESSQRPNLTRKWPPMLRESCKRQRKSLLNNVPEFNQEKGIDHETPDAHPAVTLGPPDRDFTHPIKSFRRANLSGMWPPKLPESSYRRQPTPPVNNAPISPKTKEEETPEKMKVEKQKKKQSKTVIQKKDSASEKDREKPRDRRDMKLEAKKDGETDPIGHEVKITSRPVGVVESKDRLQASVLDNGPACHQDKEFFSKTTDSPAVARRRRDKHHRRHLPDYSLCDNMPPVAPFSALDDLEWLLPKSDKPTARVEESAPHEVWDKPIYLPSVKMFAMPYVDALFLT